LFRFCCRFSFFWSLFVPFFPFYIAFRTFLCHLLCTPPHRHPFLFPVLFFLMRVQPGPPSLILCDWIGSWSVCSSGAQRVPSLDLFPFLTCSFSPSTTQPPNPDLGGHATGIQSQSFLFFFVAVRCPSSFLFWAFLLTFVDRWPGLVTGFPDSDDHLGFFFAVPFFVFFWVFPPLP